MDNIEKKSLIKQLALESWQPELIISGLAIYASFIAPQYLSAFGDFCMSNFSPVIFPLVFLIILYLSAAFIAISVNFSFHFIVRILWIGFIGLQSVYPGGIVWKKLDYTDDFKSKLKKLLPSIADFTTHLDDLASLIFAFSGLIVLLSLGICMSFLIVFLIYYCLVLFGLPPKSIYFGAIFTAFMGLSSLISLLNLKSTREKNWAKKWYFPLFRFVAYSFAPLLFRPIYYILFTFQSNFKSKRFVGVMFLYFLILGLVIGGNQNIKIGEYVDVLIRPNEEILPSYKNDKKFYLENYESTSNQQRRMRITIQDRVVKDDFLEVFVPVFYNDYKSFSIACRDSIKNVENKIAKKQAKVVCHSQLYDVFLDSEKVKAEFFDFRHPNNGEKGIIAYLPLNKISDGTHLLKVIKKLEKDSVQVSIPFLLDR